VSEKLDKIRLELVRNEATVLSKKYARFFKTIPSLESFSSRDLKVFKSFLSPPLDEYRINKKGSKPHYLLFICDVLDRVILMYQVIKSNTRFLEHSELHAKFDLFARMAQFFKHYFVFLRSWTEIKPMLYSAFIRCASLASSLSI
jgi:hypothetical protein